MKTIPLTVRRVPQRVHEAHKRSAKANNRSLNGETLTWLEKRAEEPPNVTCGELADILEKWDALLNDQDRKELAAGIEEARGRMNAEHLDKR